MLKITLHDSSEALTFQIEGKLVGAWAKELEQCWKTASSIRNRKAPIVDLSETTFIDAEGKRVLASLFREGAFFRTAGPMTRSIVEEITGKSANPWRGILTHAVLLLFALSLAKAAAQPAPLKLTLKDAIQLSLKQNPQVQIANLNIAESEQDQIAARSSLLPQIGFAATDAMRRANLSANFGRKLPIFPEHIGPFYVIQAGANFSTPLFDLTAWKRWQASKEELKGTQAQNLTVREQNVLLIVSQYLGSLRAAADVKAAQSRAGLAQALYDLSSDLQKNGAGTGIDTLRSNVQYQNEKQRLINARTQLKTSLYGLAQLLNIDPRQPIELADESEFFSTTEYSADQTMERAFTERPEMKTLVSRIRSAELRKKASSDSRLPKLSLLGGWSLQGLTPVSMIPVYQYEASLDVPLFTGGRIQAQTAVAGIEIRKLRQEEQDLRNRIGLEVKTAVAQLESAKSEVEVANLTVQLAQEEVTQARDRFQAGVANNIEVITAQDELSRAHDNQIAALYRYNQARADLAHSTGQMESLYAK